MLDVTLPSTSTDTAGRTGGRSRRRSTGEVFAYDFTRPIQLSREHHRILQLAFDAFARQAMTVYTSALRSVCQVTATKIEQRSYAEYVDSLPTTTYLTVFETDPLPGLGVLDVPLPAVMACIDHMLGGHGSGSQPQRPLTEIESSVFRGVVARLLGELRSSLAEIVAIDPRVTGVEYSPQFAQIAGPADVVITASLELRINDRPHQMSVCLPFGGLHPHLTAAAAPAPLSNREKAQRDRAAQLLQEQFQTVPVDVAVQFRGTRLDPVTLAGLQPGDVLRLAHPASAPLDVTVDGATFAHATAGARGPRLAALIVATPQEGS